uniref:Reverse transcriptase/ribonuclease h/methyltransferase n=1 Tax=Daphnia magna TaxID=35525 RepID=A0A0P6EQZ6_9CRUS
MSSRNFSRGPRDPRAEHVDSRVDYFANGRFYELDSWDRSRSVFDNRTRFRSDDRERFCYPSFRERSPLRRPRYVDPNVQYPPVQYPPVQYLDEGDIRGPPADQDFYIRDPASAYDAYFECDYDPRSYPTHSEAEPEDEYYSDTPREDDWAEYDHAGAIDRGRPWRPQTGVRFTTDQSPISVELPTLSEEAQSVAGPSNGNQGSDPRRVEDVVAVINASPPPVVPKAICDEIASLLSVGVSTEQSKLTSKEFPLVYEVSDFSLMPPKLDAWMSRRSKDKGVLKAVNVKEEALIRTQLKIMDIGPPLIDLYARLAKMEEATTSDMRRSVQAALQQWGRAFAHVSKKRRESVVHFTDPRVEYLLKDDSCFATGKEARELLFTGRFLEKMLTEANQDETLARRDKAVAATDRRNPVRSTRRDQLLPPSTRHTHYGGHQYERGSRARGRRGGGDPRGGRGRGNPNPRRYEFLTPCNIQAHPIVSISLKVGARLSVFADKWSEITDDPWVLKTISNGLKIDFLSEPFQRSSPRDVVMSDEMRAVCQTEIASLLKKGAVKEITDESGGFICSFFCVPKKVDGFRPIVNLKPLNKFIKYEHFKMENLETVRSLVRKGDWFVKLDLKDAYLTVPVYCPQQKFLRFKWEGRVFQFKCMAFGLAPAPRIFTKILKVVVAFFRKQGIRLVVYLDDFLVMNETENGTRADLKTVLDLLNALGFLINWDKSVTVPTQTIEYLGMVVDSNRLSFSLPSAKVEDVKNMCRKALADGIVSLRTIASILGNFTWAIPTIPFAQSHYRSMQRFYITESQKVRNDLSVKLTLSPGSVADLEWWLFNLESSNGKDFFPRSPDIEIFSDASLSGWGAVCDGVTTRGPWTSEQADLHINSLELLGALYALQSFAEKARGLSIRMFLDNSTAVCYMNKGGGTRSSELTAVAKSLVEFCEQRDLKIEAVHLPGVMNVEADRESRAAGDTSDWKLKHSVFNELQLIWPVDIDLFSSHWNTQLPLFVSWRPQPGAAAVNAFSLNWLNHSGYAFPPFSLIPKCLEKLRREKANLLMICPVWPSQPWFPVLLELACDVPILLVPSHDLLKSATGETHPLLLTGSLQLAAWKLSGDISDGRDFRSRWSNFSWPVTGQEKFDQRVGLEKLERLVFFKERKSLVGPSSFNPRVFIGVAPGR